MPDSLPRVKLYRVLFDTQSKNSHDWYDISKDFILPILSITLAILGAVYIFIIESRRDRKIDNEKQKEGQINRLFYLTAIIKSSLSEIRNQINYIKIWMEDLYNAPIINPGIQFPVSKNLARLTKSNLESFLLAYVDQDSRNNSRQSVEEIQMIIEAADYLHVSFKRMKQADRVFGKHFTNLRNDFVDQYNLTIPMIQNIRNDLSELKEGDRKEFISIIEHFDKVMRNQVPDIVIINTLFFRPIKALTKKYGIKEGSENVFELWTIADRAEQQYYQMIDANLKHYEVIAKGLGNMETSFETLIQNSNYLLSKY
jgi:hypothetical protein